MAAMVALVVGRAWAGVMVVVGKEGWERVAEEGVMAWVGVTLEARAGKGAREEKGEEEARWLRQAPE